MTFTITQPCVDTMDQSCVEVCPVDCIHFEEGADRMLYINPVECIDCGACQPACPVSAIFPEADIPADQKFFTEINSLWYEDPAAARAKVPGGDGAAAPAAAPAAPAPAPDEAPAAAPAGEAEAPPAAAPAAAPAGTPEAQPAAIGASRAATPAATTPESAVVARFQQVPAGPPLAARPAEMPSPLSVAAAALLAFAYYVMWVFPGPTWIRIDLGDRFIPISASVLVLVPLTLIAAGLFVWKEGERLSRFAARHARRVDTWRQLDREQLRRSEESRRWYLEQAIREIVAGRFPYPNDAHPDLRTWVNAPEPQMAVELGPGGEKLIPDIVVTRAPANFPVMIAQVETRETTTREQAHYVWKHLENRSAPLYLYVPAGYASKARDYIKDAGIDNVKLRTWRRVPSVGMVVRDV